ncbi:uncharacterized protein LOC105681999, partial [Bombus impatiens]|uniref:Uncharacterized protein LOC105681999 n=1 Tax=Bombus impatiens TaxID=132113 RepID=A0A6P3V5W0_BOMIM
MRLNRKVVHLTVAEKYDILEMRKKCESRQSAMEKYGISRATLCRIYAQSERIKNHFESRMEFSTFERRLMQRAIDIDRIVHQWYLRCKERNEQMTEADIKRRALEINMKLLGTPSFSAGRAWFQRFKKRYSITNADVKLPVAVKTETTAAEAFKAGFNRLLLDRRIILRNVYNVVYATIMWKILPERTCIM